MVLTACQPRVEAYHRAETSEFGAMLCFPLFISRIPVWAEGGVGKLWRFDCPECEGHGPGSRADNSLAKSLCVYAHVCVRILLEDN